jgi:hypothetical protein
MNIRNYQQLPIRIFAVFALSLLAYARQTGASPTAPCLAVGQMSSWDALDRMLTVKSDAGDFFDLHYEDSSTFTDGKTTLAPQDLNMDDRLCVETFGDPGQSVASHVLVTRRFEIDLRDRQGLLEWQRDSVFGTVKSMDTTNDRIAVRTPRGPDVMIDAVGPIASWTLPAQARDPADVIPSNWEKLTVGDEIYIRGDRVPGTGAIRARVIVSGGFRSFVGSIESMDPLKEFLHLRDFRSGSSRSMHFDFIPIYIVGSVSRSADRHLYSATAGDLNEGDSVLVLGREDEKTGRIDAFLLITGFSRDGIVQAGPGQSSDWIFKALGFGGPPSIDP